HDIAVEHEKLVGQDIQRSQQRSCASQRFIFHQGTHAQTESRALIGEGFDFLAEMTGEDRHVGYSRGGRELELVLENRLAAARDQYLRYIPSHGRQSAALSTRNDDEVLHA